MSRTEKPETLAPERRNRTAAIALDVTHIGRAGFLRAGFPDPGLVLRWKEIVGSEVAGLARPLKFVDGAMGGVLTLRADPAAAIFLQHESRTLCARINAWLGHPAVHRLRFVPGEIAREPKRMLGPHSLEAPANDPSIGFSGDKCLASALRRLARARQK